MFCAPICLHIWQSGGDLAHCTCSSLLSDLLVLIGKDSSKQAQAQRSGCHTSVIQVERGRQCRLLFTASALPSPQTQCSLPSPPPPSSGYPWPLPWPGRVATEWALCLDPAISSQQTSEMWAGQGSGQRRRQKHGCLRHLGSQQLTEGPTQKRELKDGERDEHET